MKILVLSFAVFCSTILVNKSQAQTIPVQIAQADDDVKKFLTFLYNEETGQESKILTNDIALGNVSIISETMDMQQIFSSSSWQISLIKIITDYYLSKSLSIPSGFKYQSLCKQKIFVRALAIIYKHISELDKVSAKLLTSFSDPAAEEKEIDDNDRQKLLQVIDGFEKLALKNINKFSSVVFQTCSVSEIENIFGVSIPEAKSQENFNKKAEENIKKEFEMLTQRASEP